jgi:uncharacterized protein YdaU (DUF1376 family)
VNFYKHHIGDYAKKTGALTLLQHGAYFLLMQAYYGTEKPLPPQDLYKICRANTKKERECVDGIVQRFWQRTETGWVNSRCDEEIQKAQWLRELAKENGSQGGRPPKAEPKPNGFQNQNPTGFKKKPSGLHSRLQTPDSTSHNSKSKRGREERASAPPARLPLDFALTQEREEVAIIAGVDPERTFEKFRDHFLAAAGPKGNRADWDAAWRIWCRDEAQGNYGSASRAAGNGVNGHPDAAVVAWSELIASDGAKRDAQVQAAIDAVGGWSAIRMRTEFEDAKLKNAFCAAYRQGKERKGSAHAGG